MKIRRSWWGIALLILSAAYFWPSGEQSPPRSDDVRVKALTPSSPPRTVRPLQPERLTTPWIPSPEPPAPVWRFIEPREGMQPAPQPAPGAIANPGADPKSPLGYAYPPQPPSYPPGTGGFQFRPQGEIQRRSRRWTGNFPSPQPSGRQYDSYPQYQPQSP